jgi:hypothetical protein
MSGVRIRHDTDRSCTYTMVSSRPLSAPMTCIVCGTVHTFKTYHITLDGEGAAIVSPEVWQRVVSMGPQTGFTLESEVKAPPPLFIDPVGRANVPAIIANPYLKEPGRG